MFLFQYDSISLKKNCQLTSRLISEKPDCAKTDIVFGLFIYFFYVVLTFPLTLYKISSKTQQTLQMLRAKYVEKYYFFSQ